MAQLLQLVITGVWAATLIIHTRRLFRLACVEQLRNWQALRLRSGMQRIWYWLGQAEFWNAVQTDCVRAIQITLLLLMAGWMLLR